LRSIGSMSGTEQVQFLLNFFDPKIHLDDDEPDDKPKQKRLL
jgi:hypothetical protein